MANRKDIEAAIGVLRASAEQVIEAEHGAGPEQERLKLLVRAALVLGESLVTDLNRIAAALETQMPGRGYPSGL
jgi:hypothetical protein